MHAASAKSYVLKVQNVRILGNQLSAAMVGNQQLL